MATSTLPSTLDNIPAMTPPNDPPLRRVLGDVSPNVKPAAFSSTFDPNNKASVASPLKRGFNAMGGGDNAGLTYLKRRRLSGDAALSDMDNNSNDSPRRVFQTGAGDNSLRFRPLLQQDEPAVPVVIQQTPTVPNTPTSDQAENPPSSQDRKSFSSLINYDPPSQPSNLQPLPPATAAISRTEMLRMKLQVAMFKVKTNQVDVQFADLCVSDPTAPPKSTAEAVEEAVAQLRREGQEALERQRQRREVRDAQQGNAAINVSSLPPVPVLQPTAYSSCKIYTKNVSSSPPAAGSPGRDSITSPDRRYELEAELTSSVIKGRVAEGLLGLRHGH